MAWGRIVLQGVHVDSKLANLDSTCSGFLPLLHTKMTTPATAFVS